MVSPVQPNRIELRVYYDLLPKRRVNSIHEFAVQMLQNRKGT
jgi:hypothetical protein